MKNTIEDYRKTIEYLYAMVTNDFCDSVKIDRVKSVIVMHHADICQIVKGRRKAGLSNG